MSKSSDQEERKEQLQKEQEQIIKITWRKLVEIFSTGKLDALEKKPLPRTISIWLGRVVDKFEDEVRTYRKEHKKLIEEFSERDKDGNMVVKIDYGDGKKEYKTQKGREEERDQALDSLLDTEIDIHIYRKKIKLSELPETMSASEARTLLTIADLVDDSTE